MPNTSIKSRILPNKRKPKIKQGINNTKSNLPSNLSNKNYYQETALF